MNSKFVDLSIDLNTKIPIPNSYIIRESFS